MEKYDEFEQYIRAKEPDNREKAGLWQTAIGLQKVDGLGRTYIRIPRPIFP